MDRNGRYGRGWHEMFFPNRRMAWGYLVLLLPPLMITLLAFVTLARVDEAAMVVGAPLDATPAPTLEPLAQAQAHFAAGLAQQAAGDLAAAEAAYQAALAIDGTLAPVYGALGSLYVAGQRPSEALTFYRQAVALEPDSAEWWRNVGVVQANLGDLAGAVGALETAVALSPDNPQLHYELGQVYAYVGRFERARQAFEQALTLHPEAALATAVADQLRLLP
jgi:tetratricopeptide (TPR) repeat protein